MLEGSRYICKESAADYLFATRVLLSGQHFVQVIVGRVSFVKKFVFEAVGLGFGGGICAII